MKIAAYNQHDVGSFSESLGLFRSDRRTRRDRANVVMQSNKASAERSRKPALSEAEGAPTSAEIAVEADSFFNQLPAP
jgi:hypothetical protein